MARRKRRAAKASKSSPEYEESARHYKESSILKPVGPSTHPDNWPCFLLSDATVHFPDGKMASQLEVDIRGPFIIRGRLELEKDNERYLVHRNMKTSGPLWIQIESSKAFSVGAKDDSLSAPVVWASGEAGWFEIVPSPCYQRLCDEMFQAVRLHYSLLDQYEAALEKLQKSKKKKKATLVDVSIDLDELLFQYARRAGDGLTLPEAYEQFHRQSIFLLSHFPRDTGHKGIKPTPRQKDSNMPCLLKAYDYSHREKSSSLEIVDGKKKGKGRIRNSVPRTTQTSVMSDVEAVASKKSQEARQSRSTRMKKRSPAGILHSDDDIVMIDSPDNDFASSKASRDRREELRGDNPTVYSTVTEEAKSSAHVLVDALEDVRRHMLQLISEGKQKKQLHQVVAKSWQTKVYMECNIRSYNSVGEIFQYHARDLVKLLGPEWHDTQIYKWAKENISNTPTLSNISEAEVNQIVRRVKKSARAAQPEKVVNENSQPGVKEYAGKQTPKSRPSGKAAGLRPSTGSKKRLRYEADFEDDMDLDENGSLRKKSKRSHYFTEEDDNDDDDDDDDDNVSIDEDDENSSGESKRHAGKDTIPMSQLVIRAEKLPPTQPQGPNQTWICEEPDCGYIVRAAHEENGQKLISSHYEEHEKEAQDIANETALNRVTLAVQEARGHLPINHLLEKIRNLGENSKRRGEVHLNGHAVPEPIKRTLLI
ncbi:hypothetical protein E0Z10_g2989 [Xylaria hypoxylon]|uniref:DNA (cytosine-5)-methyltransferase 1 replication foci domain-containing protein n=1 Tax=Xylaria hypoxylon TaxID=37992 RepID=A0A4Z0ZAW3_9PEZI|nr:hypothetical protein E0Z10_g2989 [Xylaria hypoxylon]